MVLLSTVINRFCKLALRPFGQRWGEDAEREMAGAIADLFIAILEEEMAQYVHGI